MSFGDTAVRPFLCLVVSLHLSAYVPTLKGPEPLQSQRVNQSQ